MLGSVLASVAPPMAVATEGGVTYVHVPEGTGVDLTGNSPGHVEFMFVATEDTTVTFEVEVLTPNGGSDSVFLQVDDGEDSSVFQDFPVCTEWCWASTKPVSASLGRHTLRLIHREDGLQVANVRVLEGSATFQLSGECCGREWTCRVIVQC